MDSPSSPPPAYSERPPIPPRKPVNSFVPATYQSPTSLPTSSGPYMSTPSSTSASGPWLGPDPRSSSTQSLLPDTSLDNQSTPHGDFLGRRKLLIIYIHGFLGNDQSFRSFPAHVHALLANLLADSHVIHSKIYPRYKTYRSVDVARDNFSEWLRPHESPTTDVILVGHSMGGILAADVVLMPNRDPQGTHPLKHRIIGHISLDCPFIGLHPGIVVSGISSLFKPAPTPPQDDNQGNANGAAPYSPEASSLADPSVSSLYLTNSESSGVGSSTSLPSVASSSRPPRDTFQSQPFFNQPFFNDSGLQERPFVQRMFHFANKYRNEGLIQAAARHIFSYLEFGSCLADPSGLEARYRNIRALEDVDEFQSGDVKPGSSQHMVRVRFVNYYTLCTGRPKSPKGTPKVGSPAAGAENTISPETSFNLSQSSASSSSVELDLSPNKANAENSDHLYTRQESPMPSITLEHRDTMGNSKNHQTLLDAETKTLNARASNATIKGNSFGEDESVTSDMNRLSMHSIEPTPIDEDIASPPLQDIISPTTQDQDPIASVESNNAEPQKVDADLPPLPDPPTAPELPDPSLYTEKDERKQVEREVKRLRRAHENAVKDHAKAVREREKLVEKRQKRAQKEAEKALKEVARQEKEALKESQRKEKEVEKEQQRQASEREKQAQKELDDDEEYQQFKAEEEESQRTAEAVAEARSAKPEKPRKLRKFCNLPTKGGKVEDPTWVDIYMADVDEVGAHCGLFFSGPHYEKLVGDVGNRIVGWVQDDLTKRAIQEMGM